MINTALFKKEIKSCYKLLLLFLAVLSMYAGMIISMFDPKLGESLQMMAEGMPQVFAAFGMLNVGATLLDFVVNYLYGFLLIVFPIIFMLILSNKLMVHYVDTGSMVYLLQTPNKRSKIATTQAVVLVFMMLILTLYVVVFSIVFAQLLFPSELEISKFLMINIGIFGLYILFSGISFFFSCIFNESKKANGVAGGIIALFVILQMISQVGEKFEFLKYLTPITLFNTDGIIAQESTAYIQIAVLYIVGILFFVLAVNLFSKRDLPI